MASSPPLYSLLPEHYRNRDRSSDGTSGGPLLALTELLDGPRERVEADIAALYRDWFVETCAPWALPYLAGLAGREGPARLAFDRRALVADAIAFARRKGSYTSLEHELAATTGWPVQIGFDAGEAAARYWDEPVYALREVAPSSDGPGRYRFHPMGLDCRLFAAPRPYAGMEAPFKPLLDSPVALTLEADPVLLARAVTILVEDKDGNLEAVPAARMAAADLSDWRAPRGAEKAAWVDPLLGRFLLAEPPAGPRRIAVGFAYAAPGNVGGGPYEREMARPGKSTWVAYVHGGAKPGPTAFRTLAEALEAFRKVPDDGLVRILDSGSYDAPRGDIGAAPLVCPTDPNAPRRLTIEALSGESPALRGTLRLAAGGPGLQVTLSGLWIDGRIEIAGEVEARIEHCSVHHVSARRQAGAGSTPVPAIVLSERGGKAPSLSLRASLAGPLELVPGAALTVSESAVDADSGAMAITGRPDARLVRSTLLGGAEFSRVEAIDTIFGAPLDVPADSLRLNHCFIPEDAGLEAGPDNIRVQPPVFESTVFGSPGYARLDPEAGGRIATGASNGSEIGLFNSGHRAQRLVLMEARLKETVPIGMSATLERQPLVPPGATDSRRT